MQRKIVLLTVVVTGLLSSRLEAQGEAKPETEMAAGSEPAPSRPARPEAGAIPDKKFELGVAFLPMLLGRVKVSGVASESDDLHPGYGVGLVAGYLVLPGLSVGIAPQVIFNLKSDKLAAEMGSQDKSTEIDLLARIAFTHMMVSPVAIYAEFMPGYSIIAPPSNWKPKIDSPHGFVMAMGAGVRCDLNDRFFANLGIGYQVGWQSTKVVIYDADVNTRFLRIALGGGVRL